jgi:hypothetical protein
VNTIKLGQRFVIIGGVVCFSIFSLNTSATANGDAYTLADKAIGWAGKLWDFVSVQIKKEKDFEEYENKAYPVIYSEVEKYEYTKPNPSQSKTWLRKYEADRQPPYTKVSAEIRVTTVTNGIPVIENLKWENPTMEPGKVDNVRTNLTTGHPVIESLKIRTQFRVRNNVLNVLREAVRKDKHAVYYQSFSLDQQWTKVSKDYVQVSGGNSDNILRLAQTEGTIMRGSFSDLPEWSVSNSFIQTSKAKFKVSVDMK